MKVCERRSASVLLQRGRRLCNNTRSSLWPDWQTFSRMTHLLCAVWLVTFQRFHIGRQQKEKIFLWKLQVSQQVLRKHTKTEHSCQVQLPRLDKVSTLRSRNDEVSSTGKQKTGKSATESLSEHRKDTHTVGHGSVVFVHPASQFLSCDWNIQLRFKQFFDSPWKWQIADGNRQIKGTNRNQQASEFVADIFPHRLFRSLTSSGRCSCFCIRS